MTTETARHFHRAFVANFSFRKNRSGSLLSLEPILDLLHDDVAADVADGVGEGDLLGAGLDAVLRVAEFLDSAVAGEGEIIPSLFSSA
jgi:hypothetical protein